MIASTKNVPPKTSACEIKGRSGSMNCGIKARKKTMLLGLSAVVTKAFLKIPHQARLIDFSETSNGSDDVRHILIPNQIK